MSSWRKWFFSIDEEDLQQWEEDFQQWEEYLQQWEEYDRIRQENSRMLRELGPEVDLLIQNRDDWEECAHKLAAAVDALQGYCGFSIPKEGYAHQNVSSSYHHTVEIVYGAWSVYNQLKGEGDAVQHG